MTLEPGSSATGGRPTSLTPGIQEKVLQALAVGNYRKQAAAYAGIDDSTLRRWLARGRNHHDAPYASFRKAALEAESRSQIASLGVIAKAARDGDWKAAAWLLERRVPEQYAPKSRLFDPYRVLEILEDEGLLHDRDRALQALAQAEPGLAAHHDPGRDDEVALSEEERRVLFKVLRHAAQEAAPALKTVEATPIPDDEPA